VTVRVTSDVADEIHVHGYDLKQDVEAGSTAEISFTADIPGVFEVELENAGFKLADLEVS
jgi:heme/copper-type cytochrome/quinol oxidase subunit 2